MLGVSVVLIGSSIGIVINRNHVHDTATTINFGPSVIEIVRNGQTIAAGGGRFIVSFSPFPPVGPTTVTFGEPAGTAATPQRVTYDMTFPMGPFGGAVRQISANVWQTDLSLEMLGVWRVTVQGTTAGRPFVVVLEFRVSPGH
jgi:hypothetical protein